jgi:hypothetical protein
MTTQSLQQASSNTTLTQIGHQGNLIWNRGCQSIVEERQASCRIKNDKQA